MECDSMHAAIEFAKKHVPIFVPCEWHSVVRMAGKTQTYTVIPLDTECILDFKKLVKEHYTFIKVDSDGRKVKWLKIKWMQFSKMDKDTIKIKYDFNDQFKVVCVKPLATRETSSDSVTRAGYSVKQTM